MFKRFVVVAIAVVLSLCVSTALAQCGCGAVPAAYSPGLPSYATNYAPATVTTRLRPRSPIMRQSAPRVTYYAPVMPPRAAYYAPVAQSYVTYYSPAGRATELCSRCAARRCVLWRGRSEHLRDAEGLRARRTGAKPPAPSHHNGGVARQAAILSRMRQTSPFAGGWITFPSSLAMILGVHDSPHVAPMPQARRTGGRMGNVTSPTRSELSAVCKTCTGCDEQSSPCRLAGRAKDTASNGFYTDAEPRAMAFCSAARTGWERSAGYTECSAAGHRCGANKRSGSISHSRCSNFVEYGYFPAPQASTQVTTAERFETNAEARQVRRSWSPSPDSKELTQ